jgi:hypothetical protein
MAHDKKTLSGLKKIRNKKNWAVSGKVVIRSQGKAATGRVVKNIPKRGNIREDRIRAAVKAVIEKSR